jgi:hypothetical protein
MRPTSQLGAKVIPFAGWEMPVWYTSVVEEHLAVRQAAGLFDVAHMGVYQAEGPDAAFPGQRGAATTSPAWRWASRSTPIFSTRRPT